MPKGKSEYIGKLMKNGEISSTFPIIWYRDGAGAWERLKNRLLFNGLVFNGSNAPTNSADCRDALRDLSTLCESEGADISTVPTSPLSFSKLIAALESHGLVNPTVAPKPAAPGTAELEANLSSSFNSEVQRHIQTEDLNDANGTNNILGSILNTTGIGGDLLVSPQNENYATQATVVTDPKPPGNHDVIHPPSVQPNDETISATETLELSSANQKIKKLEAEASQNRQKMLLMENALSTARGTLISEISESISDILNGGLQRLKDDLCGNLHLDISAELSRQIDPLLSQISDLNNVFTSFKTLLEDGAENTDNLHGFLGEVSAKLDINHQAIEVKVKAMSLAVSPLKDALTNVQTQLTAILTLVDEAIKVKASENSLKTPLKTAQSTPSILTPLSVPPPRYIKCNICDETGHYTRECSKKKMDFCARCLSEGHSFNDCRAARDLCYRCRDKGLGDIAYGHLSKVHKETDRKRREYISKFFPVSCFSDWDLKAKSSRS